MPKKLIAKPVEQEASKNLLANGVPTIKDLMAPPSFDRSKEDYIKVGNKFARSFLVSGYPKQIQVGWADSIYNTRATWISPCILCLLMSDRHWMS